MAGTVINSTRIEALNRDNYETWRMQIEALMVKNDLWDYVTGDCPMPVLPNGADATTIATHASELKIWKNADRKAKSDLILSIHPSELSQIKNLETSKEVWNKLKEEFASTSPTKMASLFKQISLIKLAEGADPRDHISKFLDAIDKLNAMDLKLHPYFVTILLMSTLPSSWESFKQSMASRDVLPKPEQLRIKILEEYELRTQANGTNDVIGALVTKGVKSTQNQARDGKKKKKQTCYYCRKPGHIIPTCPELPKRGNNDNKVNERGRKDGDRGQRRSEDNNDTYLAFHVTIDEANKATLHEVKLNKWILDSGCTTHVCGCKKYFDSMDESVTGRLKLASKASTVIEGKGTVKLPMTVEQGRTIIELSNTLFVPDLRTNLVSIARVADKGYTIAFNSHSALILAPDGSVKAKGRREGDLYCLDFDDDDNYFSGHAVPEVDLRLWHERMGHLNQRDLKRLLGVAMDGIEVKNEVDLGACDVCTKGKMSATPFPKGGEPCSQLLQIVHSDVVGPFRVRALNGARYFVSFIDDKSRMCQIYFLKEKSGVLEAFKMYKAAAENQTGHKIKYIQSDNGREYCNAAMDQFLQEHGIERRLTVPGTPQQNGISERMNRTLMDMCRCLLIQSGLPSQFWADAVATASHLRNRSPSSSLNGCIPLQVWTGTVPNIESIRIFGSKVFVLDKDQNKDKLAARSKEGIFIGYPRETKGYRVWLPDERKAIVARDIKFHETKSQGVDKNAEELLEEPEPSTPGVYGPYVDPKEGSEGHVSPEPTQVSQDKNTLSTPRSRCGSTNGPVVNQRGRGRPRLIRTGNRGRPRKLYSTKSVSNEDEGLSDIQIEEKDDDVFVENAGLGVDELNVDTETGETLEHFMFSGMAEIQMDEALTGNDKQEWNQAILSEINSLLENKTWEMVQSSPDDHIIGSRVVLTNKLNENGTISRRKARLVARGFSQRPGVEYNETYAPVIRLESLRLVMALSAELELRIWQFDVVTAFLNGPIDEEVLMKPPPMLKEFLKEIIHKKETKNQVKATAHKMLADIEAGGDVCRLKKAIYGLKQAGRQWYRELSQKLKTIGVSATIGDPCLFHARRGRSILLLIIYVDDILIATNDEEWKNEIKIELLKVFQLKDLGLAKYCLGLEIDQELGSITLSQRGYIKKLLVKYGMDDCNSVSIPAVPGNKLPESTEDSTASSYPYREAIGALTYLVVATRPDLANTVSRLAQYTSNPRKEHWAAIKRTFRYLAGSMNIGLRYTKTNRTMYGYSDADWGNCILDRRSYTGYCFILAGAAVSWKSQKQRIVALSSTESEYVSLAEAMKEALHQRSILREISLGDYGEMTIFVDNRGAMFIAQGHLHHPRTKHIDIKFHFIKSVIEKNEVNIEHISTKEMAADILTKALPAESHWRCMEDIGLENLN